MAPKTSGEVLASVTRLIEERLRAQPPSPSRDYQLAGLRPHLRDAAAWATDPQHAALALHGVDKLLSQALPLAGEEERARLEPFRQYALQALGPRSLLSIFGR